MWLFCFITFLSAAAFVGCSGYIPLECRPDNYKLLTEAGRLFNASSISSLNDSSLTDGWYRFDINGKQMKENFPDVSGTLKLKDRFHPCGSKISENRWWYFNTARLYALKQPHPKEIDGLVRNHIQRCRYNARKRDCKETVVKNIPQSSCIWKLYCIEELEIFVRNCGEFFVYYLQPLPHDGVYCSEETKTNTEVSPRLECQQYVNVTDSTRQWNATKTGDLLVELKCQDPLFTKQWTRFLINNQSQIIDTPIAEGCQSKLDNSASNVNNNLPCSALYRGWINGKHPTEEGVLTKKTMCFSYPTTCECQASAEISIINCGAFHIYKRREFPLCEARACTVFKNNRTENKPEHKQDLCTNPTAIKDDTRYWSSINPTIVKCDFKFHESVRYVTSNGKPLKLREGCFPKIPILSFEKCESNGSSWLDGTHPEVSMGVVPRFVCIHVPFKDLGMRTYDVCQCNIRKLILVQNCGNHYAYKLDPIKNCRGRYCVAGSNQLKKKKEKEYFRKIQPTCPVREKVPFECRLENYKFLNEEKRLFINDMNPYGNIVNDFRLKEGWYRFNGTGKQLMEGPLPNYADTPITAKFQKSFTRCGSLSNGITVNNVNFGITSELYALNQPHPKVKDGRVQRDIQACHYRSWEFQNRFPKPPPPFGFKQCIVDYPNHEQTCYHNLICDKTVQQIYVRNCGKFYVYHLMPANLAGPDLYSGIYCSEKIKTQPEVSPRLECRNYVNLTDSSRLWTATEKTIADIRNKCQDSKFTTQWTRLLANSPNGVFDTVIPENCPNSANIDDISTDTPPCGAFYRGWLSGQHPHKNDGPVLRKLCFSQPTTCECQTESDISIINCGDFYIYKRNHFPLCEARACTVPKDKAATVERTKTNLSTTNLLDLCSNYETIVDDTRYWSNNDPSFQLCDSGFRKPVRFMSSNRENLKLKEGCNSNELLFPIGKCQSRTVTWLNGEHPSNTTKPVPASVCIYKPTFSYFERHNPCLCLVRQKILIQKCVGNFFVYKLDGFENCKSRYCLQEPQCKSGFWRHERCNKDGEKVRTCYQRGRVMSKRSGYNFRPYAATHIVETLSTSCVFTCKLSTACVFEEQNVKKMFYRGMALLPFNKLNATGSFRSVKFTKGKINKVFCFNYKFYDGLKDVVLLVYLRNVNTKTLILKSNISVVPDSENRECLTLSNEVLTGETFQFIFNASSYSSNVIIKSYSIQNRDAIPMDSGTDFQSLESMCTENNPDLHCFLEKQRQADSEVDWIINPKGFLELISTADRINGKEVILTTKQTITTEKQQYCLRIKATGNIGVNEKQYKIILSVYIIFSDETVKRINYLFIKNNKDIYQFNIRPEQGCFKIQIRVMSRKWYPQSFLRLHNVNLRDEECDYMSR